MPTATITRQGADQRRWLRHENTSGEQIPAFGIVRVTGAVLDNDGMVVYQSAKPRGIGQYAVNGPTPVKVGGFGRLTFDWPAMAALAPMAHQPINGDNYGVADDTWELAYTDSDDLALLGFECHGFTVDRDGIRRTLVTARQPHHIPAKSNEAITEGEGRFRLDSYGQRDINAFILGGQAVDSGDQVILTWDNELDRYNAVVSAVTSSLIKKAKTIGTIGVGSAGSVEIWENGEKTGKLETAYLNWMHNNEDISDDTQILIKFFQDEADGEGRWVIIGADCELTPPEEPTT